MPNEFIIHGAKPLLSLPRDCLGIQLHKSLLLNKHLPVALVDAVSNKTVSYAKILNNSCRLAQSLKNNGISHNNVVGISSENNLDYFYPVIGAMFLGATVTTFDASYTARELAHCANLSKPSILFCSKTTLNVVLEATKKLGFVKKVIIIDTSEKIDGGELLDDFVSNNLNKNFSSSDFTPTRVSSSDQVAFIIYSSGTTGLPKGVLLTHKGITIRNTNSRDSRFFKQIQPGTGCALGLAPFCTGFGLSTVYLSLLFGRQVAVLSKFNEEMFLRTIQNYKITFLNLVPPIAIILAKSPLVDKYDLSSIEEIYCTAAPLPKDIEEKVKQRLKLKRFRQAYGMTETTFGVLASPYGKERPGSCGKLLPYVSAKVVDLNSAKTLGPGQRGELCFKGDQMMKGYAGNVEATRQTIDQDGWLHTGDVAYYDEDGFFYIVDRLKELIKYKGHQVAPAELEGLLLKHPKIKDAGVVGLPDEYAGELPVAFVVKQDQNLTEEDVKDFVAEQVAPYKRLRGGVRFITEIPKNPSGKILRKRLRELLQVEKSKL